MSLNVFVLKLRFLFTVLFTVFYLLIYLGSFVSPSSRGRSGLRSASSNHFLVPRTRLVTVGDRAFPVAGAIVWNSLTGDITSAPSLSIFRSRLKTFLFTFFYPTVNV